MSECGVGWKDRGGFSCHCVLPKGHEGNCSEALPGCKHGHIADTCTQCSDEAEIAELRAENITLGHLEENIQRQATTIGRMVEEYDLCEAELATQLAEVDRLQRELDGYRSRNDS